jgi:hypothetical protein
MRLYVRYTHFIIITTAYVPLVMTFQFRGRRGRDRTVVGLPMQSVPITTKIVSSNPAHREVYWIQHYMIKFVSDLRQVGCFLRVLRFLPPIKLTLRYS